MKKHRTCGTPEIQKRLLETIPAYASIENEISQQLREIKHMTHLYNNIINTSLERNDINFKNKTIIVVDDGAATGSTIIAATRSV
jgi:predicted phosphoribosyltransferase